jgi:hypothetical protein
MILADINPWLPQSPEQFNRYLVPFGGILAGLVPFFTAIFAKIRSKTESTKEESALIDFALRTEANDPQYQKMLRDITKEKTLSILFGVPIRTGKIAALMKLYDHGRATTYEIQKAWPYMTFDESDGIKFLANFDDKIQFVLATAGLGTSMLIIIVSCITLPFVHGHAIIEQVGSALFGFTLLILFAFSTQGVFIAFRLKRKFNKS